MLDTCESEPEPVIPLAEDELDGDPQLYGFEFCGSCLGDWLPNGTTMVAHRTAEIRPFDIVSIIIKPDAASWMGLLNSAGGGFLGVVKLYLGCYSSEAGPAHIVGQLEPPCVALIPSDAIEAMHRVIAAPGCGEMSADDRTAVALIRPFNQGQASGSINPTWHYRPGTLS